MVEGRLTTGSWHQEQKLARRDEDEIYGALRSGSFHRTHGRDRIPTFAEAAVHYVDECQRKVDQRKESARTLYDKRCQLNKELIPRFGDFMLDEIDAWKVESFRRDLHKRVSGPRVNRYLSTLSGVFKLYSKLLGTNPVRAVDRYEETEDGYYAFTEEELQILLAHAAQDSNPHIEVILLSAFDTLLRIRNLLDLRRDQIDWRWRDSNGTLRGLAHVPWTKSKKALDVPLSLRVRRVWQQHFRALGESEWLFPNVSNTGPADYGSIRDASKRVLKAAGMPETLRIHDLRHGGATELIRRGARRATVQALLGNKTRVMTDRYIHLTEDDAAQALTHGPGEKPGFVIDFVIDDEDRAAGEGK